MSVAVTLNLLAAAGNVWIYHHCGRWANLYFAFVSTFFAGLAAS